jgi:hypothetical protein
LRPYTKIHQSIRTRQNTSAGCAITIKYYGLRKKLTIFEQVEKRLIVDVFMTGEINLTEFEQGQREKLYRIKEVTAIVEVLSRFTEVKFFE